MLFSTIKRKTYGLHGGLSIIIAAVAFVSVFGFSQSVAAKAKQTTFASAEEAVKAFVAAARNDDVKELSAIFGPDAQQLVFSGDTVADSQRRNKFLEAYDQQNTLVPEGDGMVLVVGKQGYPFPIPVVRKGRMWVFDTGKGKEEILNRRIGNNELSTIQVMLAIVDAQREYAMMDRDGDGLLEYAEKFRSDPGKKNGLYWETKEGEQPSPLGELVAKAKSEGYAHRKGKKGPSPYHGYYFRILKAQGTHAPGGACDYVVRGNMIGGFAVVAYPAKYGNSGVMTFIVNYDGVVYEKDLGLKTATIAKAMKRYDTDGSWKTVERTTGK